MHPDQMITDRLTPTHGSSSMDREYVHHVLSQFDTLMVATFKANGSAHPETLHVRPMAIAKLDLDCTISFLTQVQTAKVAQVVHAPEVGQIIGQNRSRYLTLTGSFELSQDRARIEAMWKKSFELWFSGPDDPTVVLMAFHPDRAELWDASGTRGLKYLFESAKALVTGEKPTHDVESDMHKIVPLG